MNDSFKILIIFTQLVFFNSLFAQSWLLQVNSRDGTRDTYMIEDIKKITFEKPSGIQSPNQNAHTVKSFKLFQNYPNPFNPYTNIKFEVTKPGQVQIRISNSIGQVVKEFTKNIESTGIQTITWDGRNQEGKILASGLYICQVQFEELFLVKKMILLK